MVVVNATSDIDRIILVSRAKRYSRVVDIPQMNSESSNFEIEIRPANAGSGLQTNTAIDEDGPSLEHVAESMGLNSKRPVLLKGNEESGDVPSTEEIRKQILGR